MKKIYGYADKKREVYPPAGTEHLCTLSTQKKHGRRTNRNEKRVHPFRSMERISCYHKTGSRYRDRAQSLRS